MNASSDSRPLAADLVLVGGGHAHVHVLKMLGMSPWREMRAALGIRVSLIAKDVHTPYSGMLPGYVAGHYEWDEIHLDLNKLCRFASVRLVHAVAEKITYDAHVGKGRDGGGWVYCRSVVDGTGGAGERIPPIRYDCLSINVGIAPAIMDPQDSISSVIPVKPISGFCHFFDNLLQRVEGGLEVQRQKQEQQEPYTLCVVGGGAGGIELAFSMQYRLSQRQQQLEQQSTTTSTNNNTPSTDKGQTTRKISVVLVTQGATLLEGHNAKVRHIVERVLRERDIRVHYRAKVVRVVVEVEEPSSAEKSSPPPVEKGSDNSSSSSSSSSSKKKKRLVLAPDSECQDEIVADDVLWCVTAGAPAWLSQQTPFACSEQGFLRVSDTYECVHHPGVFAAGDCCHFDLWPCPKAGVFAVRSGPYLVENVMRYLQRLPLRSHRPQRDFLGLLATGDRYAVASKGNWLALEGEWMWRFKDWIDRKWMAKYSTEIPDVEEMMASNNASPSHRTQIRLEQQYQQLLRSKGLLLGDDDADGSNKFHADPMRCGGCGAKVGSTVVARVLRQVYERQVARALARNRKPPPDLDPYDAAVLPVPAGTTKVIQSIDYFRELVTDPFVFGKIVAVHALSDVHAMGVQATSALVLAVVPYAADEAMTESTLVHLLSGVSDVLQDENVQLAGGHTCEGSELACGLSVTGFAEKQQLLRKRGGKVGDVIVLTKPLGTGALFAADMRAKAKGEYVLEAIESMTHSNVHASRVAAQMGNGAVHACTDVTGFGLVGHMLEMLMANEGGKKDRDDAQTLPSIGAVLDITSMPFLRGGMRASSDGIFSSLQPSNARNRRAVVNHTDAAAAFPVEYPLLFDPQTAGGLLFFVGANESGDFCSKLRDQGVSATVVGRVVEHHPTSTPGGDGGVCTIGSGETVTGHRIRISW